MTTQQPETRVYLFGQFCMEHSQQDYQHFESSKALELFCYLLVNHDSPQPREVLSSLLWGDSSEARSKKNLRQALWQLQGVLRAPADNNQLPVTSASKTGGTSKNGGARHTGDAGQNGNNGKPESDCSILDINHTFIQINRKAGLWIDVEQFKLAYNAFLTQKGLHLSETDAQCLKTAVQLYRGDLLEGWFQDWCLFERERLQNMFFEMLEKLMAYCEIHRQYDDGIAYGARILRIDRARERAYRSLMRLNFLAGDRTEALRQYERCETALREELGVEPSQKTKVLRIQILKENMNPPTEPLAPPVPPVPAAQAVSAAPAVQIQIPNTGAEPEAIELVAEIRQLLTTMTEVQTHLEDKIRQLEKRCNLQQ